MILPEKGGVLFRDAANAQCYTQSTVFTRNVIIFYLWSATERGKSKNSQKQLSQCCFVHHKSHMDCLNHRANHCCMGDQEELP
jgi:hypothetical protein